MGHIKLAAPVSHIWFLKGIPSYLGLLLDMTLKDLEQVIYFNSYVVLDPADSEFKKLDLLTEEEYDSYKADISNFSEEGLELELLRKFKLASGKTKKTTRMFAFDPSVKTTNASADSLDSVVSKYIRG